MSTCTEHVFRVVRREWGDYTTFMRDGVLVEGPQKNGEVTDESISCVVCGYEPELVADWVDDGSAAGETIWVADPSDPDEDARLRAAGFTIRRN